MTSQRWVILAVVALTLAVLAIFYGTQLWAEPLPPGGAMTPGTGALPAAASFIVTPATAAPTGQATPGEGAAMPTVQITSPVSGTKVAAGQSLTVQSAASSPLGITRIELWADGQVYATAENPISNTISMAASQAWTSATGGVHTLEVRAYDSRSRVGKAPAVVVNVTGSLARPMVWFVSPNLAGGRIMAQADQPVTLDYWATAGAGVARIELWGDGALVGSTADPNHPTSLHVRRVWSTHVQGDHTLFLRTFDTAGDSAQSTALVIGVTDGNPPAIRIQAPLIGAQLPAGQTVEVVANASDSKGITHLELWVDGALYSSWDSPNPAGEPAVALTLAWQVPSVGIHDLSVRAFDSVGLSTDSALVTVIIVGPTAVRTPFPTATPVPTGTPVPTVAADPNGHAGPDGDLTRRHATPSPTALPR